MALSRTVQPHRIYKSFMLLGVMIVSYVKSSQTILKSMNPAYSSGEATATATMMTMPSPGSANNDKTAVVQQPTMESSSPVLKSPVAQQLFDLSKTLSNNDPWKSTLLSRLTEVVELCGELCRINSVEDYQRYIVTEDRNPWFVTLNIPLPHCPSILKSRLLDVTDNRIPFPIPKELEPYYSWNSQIRTNSASNVSEVYAGGEALQSHWTMTLVQNWTQLAAAGKLEGNYLNKDTERIRNALKEHGKIVPNVTTVLVIGSESPWLEAVCLSLGVKHVTTLEYGSIVSHHPQISTLTPEKLGEQVLMSTTTSGGQQEAQVVQQFDLVVTYSSVEHSGLGRYGDALNPWGDLLAVARASCLLKPEGRMMLGVPTGRDRVEFNFHRIYGVMRYPILTNQLQVVNEEQLRKWEFKRRLHKPRKSHFQYPVMLERLR